MVNEDRETRMPREWKRYKKVGRGRTGRKKQKNSRWWKAEEETKSTKKKKKEKEEEEEEKEQEKINKQRDTKEYKSGRPHHDNRPSPLCSWLSLRSLLLSFFPLLVFLFSLFLFRNQLEPRQKRKRRSFIFPPSASAKTARPTPPPQPASVA